MVAVILESWAIHIYFSRSCTDSVGQLIALLVCRPIAYNWNHMIEGRCYNQPEALEAVGIVNLLTDLLIFILPMPMLWGLQLPLGKKIGLTITFGIGLMYILNGIHTIERDMLTKSSVCAFSTIRVVEFATLVCPINWFHVDRPLTTLCRASRISLTWWVRLHTGRSLNQASV